MHVHSLKLLATGLLYIVLGGGFAVASAGYRIGSPAAMGPGFFPFWVAILLVLVGAGIFVSGLRGTGEREALPHFPLRAPLCVLLCVVLFALLLQLLGLPLTVALTTFVAGAARPGTRWGETALLAAILAVGAVVIFILGLGLQIPLWPAPIGA